MDLTDAPHTASKVPEPAAPTDPRQMHKQWHSRGYVPHFDSPGMIQSIVFRLHDALPERVVNSWKEELGWRDGLPQDHAVTVKLRRRVHAYEDKGHGDGWLAHERIALLVQDALLHFDGLRYRLLAWCIMPNHVHAMIETQ